MGGEYMPLHVTEQTAAKRPEQKAFSVQSASTVTLS